MSEPFIAEIRIFAGTFAPRGWAFCNGQLLPIAQNTALFSLIGTIYGGDGQSTMALPDMKARAPMHSGRGPGLSTRRLGQRVGVNTVTLTESQLPNHHHTVRAVTAGRADASVPSATTSFGRPRFFFYQNEKQNNLVPLAYEAIDSAGGSQSHNNQQPYLGLNFIIALQGLYPSRG